MTVKVDYDSIPRSYLLAGMIKVSLLLSAALLISCGSPGGISEDVRPEAFWT
jgi:hypothetical protein